MITMTIVVKVRPEKREEFLQAIRSIQDAKRKEKGISRSKVYQDVDDETGFSVLDEWETNEDLDHHFIGENFKVLLGALKILCTEGEFRYGPFRRKGIEGSFTRVEKHVEEA